MYELNEVELEEVSGGGCAACPFVHNNPAPPTPEPDSLGGGSTGEW